ncbi:MAG: prolyl aminopeptidase [Thermomicrobiales bacterium]|nr:prolyl aminopeptidase [Thermomicrobiales bacterium]
MTRDLYPGIDPYETGQLDVGDGHSIYWETSGNPDRKPAVALHGGPGSGTSPFWRKLFDPERYRIIAFDQRGCGRSTPDAGDVATDLGTNTTHHLLADIERLREHLGVERWLVLGGSWGATLALAYAERHPELVTELVLFAVTNTTRREVDWITRQMGRLFPEEWDRFRNGVPESERDGGLSAAYARLLADPDPAVRARAASSWCEWEDVHMSLASGNQHFLGRMDPAWQMTFARLVTHYWSHAAWLEEGELVRNATRLAGIPGLMVDGRLDVSGPPDIAWHIAQGWPDAERVLVSDAGHGHGVEGYVVAATDRFADHSHDHRA